MGSFVSLIQKSDCLIIGGAGYIGATLTQLLIESGRKVTVLGRVPRRLCNTANYIVGDFSNKDLISELLHSHHEVVHLAHATSANTTYSDSISDLRKNIEPTIQLFEMSAHLGVKTVYVSSGGTVYGDSRNLPIKESHSLEPISFYGQSKLIAETYGDFFARTRKLKYICLRPSNAYGPGQIPFTGQGFISTAIGATFKGKAVQIFGKEGTIRDYIYIDDLCYGILSALEKGKIGEAYNISSAEGMSNLDIVSIIRPLIKSYGYDLKVEHLPSRISDVQNNVLCNIKIADHTNWSPKTNIHDGIKLTIDWLNSQLFKT